MQELQENEIIKDIKDYEGLYAITSFGRVWAYPKTKSNKFGKFLKLTKTTKGYICTSLTNENGRKTFKVHRLVAYAFLKNENKYPQINHKDGIKSNNKIENLEWCNNSQNGKHANMLGLKLHQGMRYKNKPVKYVGIRVKNATFQARIKYKQKEYSKHFKNEIDAVKWYNQMAIIFFGEKARLNIIVGEM